MGLLTERLLNAQYHNHEEGCCCGECGCENEHNHEEIVEKSLSESEIEEIINEKYSEKDEKTKEFIRKGLRKFGDRFDYSKTEYKNAKTNVLITCLVKDHGDFEINPSNFLTRGRCQKCGKESDRKHRTHTIAQFLIKARKVHGDKYDYSKVNYINEKTKVIIICPIHGEFLQTPRSHLVGGSGCPICANNVKLTTEQFIERANEVHGRGTYLYHKVNYVNAKTPVEIYDPIFDEFFFQTPDNHLCGAGNPSRSMSSGERMVYTFLKEQNIPFEREIWLDNTFGRNGGKIRVDFFLKDAFTAKNIIIEYNGVQHYKYVSVFHKTEDEFKVQIQRDIELRDYCKKNLIYLIEIPYILNKYSNISDFLTKTIIEGIDPSMLVDYDSLYIFDDNST